MIVLMIFGIVLTGLVGLVIFKGHKTKKWPMTIGKVLSSNVRRKEKVSYLGDRYYKTVTFEPCVKYEYSVGGKKYVCNVLSVNSNEFKNLKKAELMLKNFPSEKQISVHYNPADIKEAVLISGNKPELYILLIIGLICISVGTIYYLIDKGYITIQ